MAFDGIVIAGLVHELNFPSFFISDGHQQDKSPAGAYILYGFTQTYRKRADHKHYTAPYGAHHPSED